MDASALAPVLTAGLAQEIAGETSGIIGFNVLITDRDGMVIGSGDTGRVGTFHEASVEVMRTRQPATHSAAQARRLRGVRPGITLPIVLNGSALGTVGITGAPSQVRRFGLVVKRQTEILLEESVLLRSRLLRERALDELVRDIAYFDADVVEPDLITYRAAELGYDLTLPRVAVVIGLASTPDRGEAAARPALLQILRATFPAGHDIIAATAADRFVVLHRIPAARHAADAEPLCRRAVDEIGRRYRLTAAAGIGDAATTVTGLHDSYQDATMALALGARLGIPADAGATVASIDNLRIEQFVAAAGHRPRARLVESTTASLRQQTEWPALRQTVIAWCETGFNLVHAAAALHIHRNTLVYRLNKIAKLTGRPVRDHRAALALYLACLTDQLDRGHGAISAA
jgi:carbohydrate diacid regulator